MEPPRLILASKSPRRARLLRQMGFDFEVVTGDVAEEAAEITDPVEHVLYLSRRKAESVVNKVPSGLVIGADTIVTLNARIYGKPADEKDARRMLNTLSGQTHRVYTGFTLWPTSGEPYADVEKTLVTFRFLESWEIDDYIATGGPMDKAGAYGIQDRSGLFVDHIEGCFYNVVGFPLTKFYEGLKQMLGRETLRSLMKESKSGSDGVMD